MLNYYGLYCDGDWNRHCGYIYISSINNTSVSISLYYLVLFYIATEERLAPFKPFHKFLSVKAILVMSFWQASLFQLLHLMELVPSEYGGFFLNLIICGEMVGCAVAQAKAFPYTDYMDDRIDQSNSRHQKRNEPNFCQKFFQIVFASRDVIDDARNTFIKDLEDERERATQLDVMRKKEFNWSDEELLVDMNSEEAEKKMLKEKYGKKKQSNFQKALIYKQNVQGKLAGQVTSDSKYKKMKDVKDQKI